MQQYEQLYTQILEQAQNIRNKYPEKLSWQQTAQDYFAKIELYSKITPTGIRTPEKDLEQGYTGIYTYNGIDDDGQPIKETWGGGVHKFMEGDMVLNNQIPILDKQGLPVRGEYYKDNDGNKAFRPDPQGKDILMNEYVSTEDFVSSSVYNVQNPQQLRETQYFIKNVPVVAIPIHHDLVLELNGVPHQFKNGDFMVAQADKKGNWSYQCVQKDEFNKTYRTVESILDENKMKTKKFPPSDSVFEKLNTSLQKNNQAINERPKG